MKGRANLVKFRFNIFFVISLVCISLLIGYIWLYFLPIFQGSLEYDAIKTVVIVITILLAISGVLTFLQMIGK